MHNLILKVISTYYKYEKEQHLKIVVFTTEIWLSSPWELILKCCKHMYNKARCFHLY